MLYREFPSKTDTPLDKAVKEAADGIWDSSPDAYISLDEDVKQPRNLVRVYTDGLIAQATKKTVIKNGVKVLTQVITVPSFGYGCYKYNDDIDLITRVFRRKEKEEDEDEEEQKEEEDLPWALGYAYETIYVDEKQLSMNFLLGEYVKRVEAIPGSPEKGDEEPLLGLKSIPWETLLSEAGVGECTVTSERFGERFDGYTTYTIEFPELGQGQSEPGLIELRSSESFVSRVTALNMSNDGGFGLDNALIFGDNSVANRFDSGDGAFMEDFQGVGEPVLTQEAGTNFYGNPTPEYWEIPVKKRNKYIYSLHPTISHGTIIFSGPEKYTSKKVVSYQCEEGSRGNTVTTTEIVLADDGLSYTLKSETTYGEVSDDARGCKAQEPVITKSNLSATIRQVHSNMVAKWKENKFLMWDQNNSPDLGVVADKVTLYDPEPGSSVSEQEPGSEQKIVTYLETFFQAYLPLNSPILKWDYVVHESEYTGNRGYYFDDEGLVPTNNHKVVTLDFSNVEPTTITFVPLDRSGDPNYEPDPDNPEPEPFEENVLFLDCDAAIDKSEEKERTVWTPYFPERVPGYGPPPDEDEESYAESSGMYAYPSNAWDFYTHPTGFGSLNDYMLPENEVFGLGGEKLWPDELPKWHETTETFVIGAEEEEEEA